ncbi:B9 domain [Phytophthora cactorum]|nr:B9 domain [Phytophthora cactorum]
MATFLKGRVMIDKGTTGQKSSMPLTQYYHVRDPMENLLISVTLRKISGFGSDSSDNSVPVGRTWTYSFQWQEKKLSLSEKKREIERLEARGINYLLEKHRGDRKSSESDNTDILSSYVDVDDFIPKEYGKEPPSTSKDSVTHLIPPDLTRRPRDKRNETSWTPNQRRAWLRANREDKFRAMHIVALIEGMERVLCSLRFYKETGLFCATPGFSAPIVEPENDPDLLIKGPRLSTYHIATSSGSLYEYVLDNIHDLYPFASAEDQRLSRDIRLQEEKRDIAEVTRWHQPNKNPKLSDPRIVGSINIQRKMMISLEVVAVDNPKTTDPVFVEYELELPGRAGYPQWKLQPGNYTRKRGKTPLSLPQRSAYPGCLTSAAFGYQQHFNLKLVKGELSLAAERTDKEDDFGNIVASPVLHLSVYSRDSWRRKRTQGHGEIKLTILLGLTISTYLFTNRLLPSATKWKSSFWDDNLTRDRSQEVSTDESPISTMIISRLGQKSESTSSTVRVRCNIVNLQPSKYPGDANNVRLTSASIATPFVNTRVVKRSVQEILQSVKLEKRLASITDPRLQAALRSPPPTDVAATTQSLIDKSDLV